MKVYVLYAKENWITDELAKEWIQHNSEFYTTNLLEADTIWVLSNYIIHQIPHSLLLEKRVIITIHHIVPWKMNDSKRAHYRYLDEAPQQLYRNLTQYYQLNPLINFRPSCLRLRLIIF